MLKLSSKFYSFLSEWLLNDEYFLHNFGNPKKVINDGEFEKVIIHLVYTQEPGDDYENTDIISGVVFFKDMGLKAQVEGFLFYDYGKESKKYMHKFLLNGHSIEVAIDSELIGEYYNIGGEIKKTLKNEYGEEMVLIDFFEQWLNDQTKDN
jgi:hypothetical protein